jgi:hypothetical protein
MLGSRQWVNGFLELFKFAKYVTGNGGNVSYMEQFMTQICQPLIHLRVAFFTWSAAVGNILIMDM